MIQYIKQPAPSGAADPLRHRKKNVNAALNEEATYPGAHPEGTRDT
jgi:hypothetical protein